MDNITGNSGNQGNDLNNNTQNETDTQTGPMSNTANTTNTPATENTAVSPAVGNTTVPPVTPAPAMSTPAPTNQNQKKSNGPLIAIIATMAVVLVAVIAVLAVVLINNNSSKSQSSKGGSYYEEDDDRKSKDDEDEYGTGGISCLGYQFEKQSGYNYTCEDDGLEISGSTFAMYIELVEGLSYYQVEGHVEELAEQLSQEATIKGNRNYAASNGKKMLVFDVDNDGIGMYFIITAASPSSVLAIQTMNDSGEPTTTDLETAASLLGNSNVSSKLPEDESDDNTNMPTIDWSQYLDTSELQK